MRSIELTEPSLSHESINNDPIYLEFHSKLIDIQTKYAHGDPGDWPSLHREAAHLIQKIESALKKRVIALHPESELYLQLKNIIPFAREIEQKTNLPRAA